MNEISIHALREEGDRMDQPITRAEHISIHALREEGDFPRYARTARRSDFYPRPPRGGRQAGTSPPPNFSQFLSTPSARRATHKSRNPKGKVQFLSTPSARRATSGYGYGDGEGSGISIHALREEGDVQRPI